MCVLQSVRDKEDDAGGQLLEPPQPVCGLGGTTGAVAADVGVALLHSTVIAMADHCRQE